MMGKPLSSTLVQRNQYERRHIPLTAFVVNIVAGDVALRVRHAGTHEVSHEQVCTVLL
jgi:hypothetical protein